MSQKTKSKTEILEEVAALLRDIRDDKPGLKHATVCNLIHAVETSLTQPESCTCNS